jgi:steroid delta-isomerase-like uncharacterized protein
MCSSEPWLTFGRDYAASLALLSDPGREVHVAEVPDLVGFVALDMRGTLRGYIQSVCVVPEFRGQGIGTALLGWAEGRILRDSPNVFLCVSSFNEAALRLYLRLGYTVVGELKDFMVTGHGELLLRKTVGSWAGFHTAGGQGPRLGNVALIEKFYHEMWNRFDKGLIPALLTEDIRFRGSLGPSKVGHEQFGEYVDFVRAAFPDFTNHIEEIVSEGDRAFARLTYRGTHQGELFEVAPTGRQVEYAGAALFHFRDGRIAEVWVLGDLYGLLKQLTNSGA